MRWRRAASRPRGEPTEVARLLGEFPDEASRGLPNGATPFYMAAQDGREACLRLLLENSADPGQARSDGVAPVFAAVGMGYEA